MDDLHPEYPLMIELPLFSVLVAGDVHLTNAMQRQGYHTWLMLHLYCRVVPATITCEFRHLP